MYNVVKSGFICFFLLLLFPLSAKAVTFPGSAGGSSSAANVYGGGGGGNISYWDLARVDWDNLKRLPADLRFDLNVLNQNNIASLLKKRKNRLTSSKLEKYLFADQCPGGQCPKFTSVRGSGNFNAGLHNVHYAWGKPGQYDGIDPGPNYTLGFNVRIWRENPRTGRFDLILRRSVGSYNNEGDTDQSGCRRSWIVPTHSNWWGGCEKGSGFGSIYTGPDPLRGGPLGPHYQELQKQCLYVDPSGGQNPRSQEKGMQDVRIDSITAPDRLGNLAVVGERVTGNGFPVRSQVIPGNADFGETMGSTMKIEGDCYWEGNKLGNPFTWNDANGTALSWIRANAPTRGPVDQFGWIPKREGPDSASDVDRGSEDGGGNNASGFWTRNRYGVIGKGLQEAVWLRWSIPNKNGKADLDYRIEGVPGLAYAVHIARVSNREQIQSQHFNAFVANPLPGKFCSLNQCPPPPPPTPGSFPQPKSTFSLAGPESLTVNEKGLYTPRLKVENLSENAAVFPQKSTFWHYTPQYKYSGSGTPFSGPTRMNEYANYQVYDQSFQQIAGLGMRTNPGKPRDNQWLSKLEADAKPLDPVYDFESNPPLKTLPLLWRKPTLANPCPLFEQRLINPNTNNFSRSASWLSNTRGTACPNRPFFNSWDDMIDGQVLVDKVFPLSSLDTTTTGYRVVELRCPPGLRRSFITLSPGQNCSDMPQAKRVEGYFDPAKDSSPVRVVFEGDSAGQTLTLYHKGEAEPLAGVAAKNPISNLLEVNLCNPGRHPDVFPKGVLIGDPNCRGPAFRWYWKKGSGDKERTDRCTITRKVPDRGWAIDKNFVEGTIPKRRDLQSPSAATAGESLHPANYGDFPTRLGYEGSLPGEKRSGAAFREEPEGTWMGCAHRKEYEVRNVYTRFEVQNRQHRVHGENKDSGDGAPKWKAPGDPWVKIADRACKSEREEDWVQDWETSRTEAKKGTNCWYSRIYPSAPSDNSGWSGWNREKETRCSPSGISGGFSKENEAYTVCFWRWQRVGNPPTGSDWDVYRDKRCWLIEDGTEIATDPDRGNDCYFRYNTAWRYQLNAPNDWSLNWTNAKRGYVNHGDWASLPKYGTPGTMATQYAPYMQPGYSRINPGAGLRSASAPFEGIIATPGEERLISNGIFVTLEGGNDGRATGPWGLRAGFDTRTNVRMRYQSETVENKTGGRTQELYINVLQSRFSG